MKEEAVLKLQRIIQMKNNEGNKEEREVNAVWWSASGKTKANSYQISQC